MASVTPRFHVPGSGSEGDEVVLPSDEAHHLTRVLRLGPGAEVRVFDGRGVEREARVVEAGRAGVRVALGRRVEAAVEMAARVTLAQAVLKHDAMDAVVRDATMLGAVALVPVISARCAVSTRAATGPGAIDRWRRVAIASAKQSGRAVVPDIHPPARFAEWVAQATFAVRLVLVEPTHGCRGEGRGRLAAWRTAARAGGAVVAVGPEGGWTADEVEHATRHGFEPWSLGGRTLRADVAPVAALAILSHAWDDDAGVRS